MRKVININIPEPCHEDWNAMTPKEKGRHCSVCKKTVIDFTKSTDEQIIKSLEQHGKLCGRFKQTQLDREIVLNRKDNNNYLSFVASSLFAFLSVGVQDMKAQEHTKIVQIDSTKHNSIKGKIATSIIPQKLIEGTVLDELGLPLPGINVTIKGTKKNTFTDFDGNYFIKAKVGDILVHSYIGLLTKSIIVSTENKISITLKDDKDVCNENVVIAGFVEYNYISACERKKIKEARKLNRQKIRNVELERTTIGKALFKMSNVFRRKL